MDKAANSPVRIAFIDKMYRLCRFFSVTGIHRQKDASKKGLSVLLRFYWLFVRDLRSLWQRCQIRSQCGVGTHAINFSNCNTEGPILHKVSNRCGFSSPQPTRPALRSPARKDGAHRSWQFSADWRQVSAAP